MSTTSIGRPGRPWRASAAVSTTFRSVIIPSLKLPLNQDASSKFHSPYERPTRLPAGWSLKRWGIREPFCWRWVAQVMGKRPLCRSQPIYRSRQELTPSTRVLISGTCFGSRVDISLSPIIGETNGPATAEPVQNWRPIQLGRRYCGVARRDCRNGPPPPARPPAMIAICG